mgnify:CR=1 FL=1
MPPASLTPDAKRAIDDVLDQAPTKRLKAGALHMALHRARQTVSGAGVAYLVSRGSKLEPDDHSECWNQMECFGEDVVRAMVEARVDCGSAVAAEHLRALLPYWCRHASRDEVQRLFEAAGDRHVVSPMAVTLAVYRGDLDVFRDVVKRGRHEMGAEFPAILDKYIDGDERWAHEQACLVGPMPEGTAGALRGAFSMLLKLI